LVVQSVYRSKGLPGYLQPALAGNDVYIIGVRGVALDDSVCLVRLSKLEALLAAARQQAGNHGYTLSAL
jgi:hypothetical protein